MSHRPVFKRASIGEPNLSWERHKRYNGLKGKGIGAQALITQRYNIEEVRRFVVDNK